MVAVLCIVSAASLCSCVATCACSDQKQDLFPMHRWRAATGSCHVLLVACMLLLVAVPWAVRAQGLAPKDQGRVASAPASFVSVTQLFRSSRSFRNAVRTPKRNACTSGRGSLCGSDGSSIELEALRLAASPQTFDARSDFVGLQVLTPVKNQANCNIWCVPAGPGGAASGNLQGIPLLDAKL